ncbi:hypothetical protein RUND412_008588 [Rhizina undulata]
MDSYQKSLIDDFFEGTHTSHLDCHQFIQERLSPQLFPTAKNRIEVKPSPYQGSLSYTCIAEASDQKPNGEAVVVQFRRDKISIDGNVEANRLHPSIVPLVTAREDYAGLFVYTSPLAEGTPCIEVIMARREDLPLEHRLTTVDDLVRIIWFMGQNLPLIFSKLPLVLTHTDLSPLNYLVDPPTGKITTVLDWDGASYLPLGRNFHFVEHVFGYMTTQGWENYEGHKKLEDHFNARVRELLEAQGFEEDVLRAVECSKALGILEYFVPKFREWKDDRPERYLRGYLRNLSWEE